MILLLIMKLVLEVHLVHHNQKPSISPGRRSHSASARSKRKPPLKTTTRIKRSTKYISKLYKKKRIIIDKTKYKIYQEDFYISKKTCSNACFYIQHDV